MKNREPCPRIHTWPVAWMGIVVFILTALPSPAAAQRFATGGPYNTPAGKSPTAELLRDVGIEQHLDAPLPLETVFRDETGREVHLGDYFTDKPVVLALVQYRCPMLCTQVLNGFLKASQAIPLEIGRDYQFIAISFDAREGSDLTAEKKKHYARVYRRPGAANGMHFLTGDQAAIDQITKTVGFRYHYVARSDQFAHASGVMIATPGGRLARYLYGIEYSPSDLRLGLVEASGGRIGSPVDQVLLLCYHYDPLTGKYGLAIAGVMRIAGSLTILVLGYSLVAMYRRERSRPKLVRETSPRGVSIHVGWSIQDVGTVMIDDGFRLLPEQASTHAPRVDLLYYFLLGLSLFFTVLITTLIIYFSIKYRRGNTQVDRTPGPNHSMRLEIIWMVIPLLLSMTIFSWGSSLYFSGYRPPAGATEIRVVAKQWMWKFQHPDGQREINTLHVPLGRAVKMIMISEDVIHSFYVPAFRVKRDVLPGSYSSCWFEATRTGEFHLFCAEYCGTNHSRMVGRVIVMEPAEYEDWLGGGVPKELPAVAGQRLFEELRCITCHRSGGATGRCPPLAGLFGREVKLTNGATVVADENYLRESILRPTAKVVAGYQPLMPSYDGQLDEEQLIQLISYIKSLAKP